MKKVLLAATALTAIIATPALADGDNMSTDTESYALTADNPAKCNLESADYTVTLDANDISNDDGFALNTVSDSVANKMNAENVTAWCTGASNTLQMYRTAFITDGGDQGSDGFNRAVVYDVTMNIADATRSDNYSPLEGTSDGQGAGPGVGSIGAGLSVGRFGPTGSGSPVVFAAELPSEAVSDGGTQGTNARSSFSSDGARLIAGQYTSTLTIELTPGV